MTQTCWLYAAVSSDPQAETLADQIAWGERTAREAGWSVARIFQGVSSGHQRVRALLETLLTELRAVPKGERPARVLLIRLDRLGRGSLDVIGVLAQIRRLGVTLHTREDGDVRLANASEAILPIFKSITAEIENEIRSEKWKATHARRRAAGLHVGTIPYGVTLLDGRAIPYEPEAAIVRRIFELRAEGWGYARLARWARTHAPAKQLLKGRSRPLRWARSSILAILQGPTIRRVVVSEALVLAVDEVTRLDFRASFPKRHPWPLVGALKCSCGRRLSQMISGRRGESNAPDYRYYVCNHPETHGRNVLHRALRVEAAFLDTLKRLKADPSLVLDAREQPDLSKLKLHLSDVRRRLDAIDVRRRRAWELEEAGAIDAKQLRSRLDEVDRDREIEADEVARTEAALARVMAAKTGAESLATVLDDLVTLWPDAEQSVQRQIARAVGDVVGGLWCIPERKGELFTGHDVAVRHITDALRTVVASSAVNIAALVASVRVLRF